MVSQSIIDQIRREHRWGFKLAQRLPQVSVGTGLTKHKRPPLPEEVSPRYPRIRRALLAYWRDCWPIDSDGERYQLNTAMTWARSNAGPESKTPQHIHWYAQNIMELARFLSPEFWPEVDGHTEHVMQGAVETVYKIGVLFREATWKQEHEAAAIATYERHRKRLEGSAKGGDTTKRNADDRKLTFARIAIGSVREWIALSPTQQVRFLKDKAQQHDTTADPKIFQSRGALLSNRWFGDELSELRASGATQEALQRP